MGIERRFHDIGDAAAISRLILRDGDFLAREMLENILGIDDALPNSRDRLRSGANRDPTHFRRWINSVRTQICSAIGGASAAESRDPNSFSFELRDGADRAASGNRNRR